MKILIHLKSALTTVICATLEEIQRGCRVQFEITTTKTFDEACDLLLDSDVAIVDLDSIDGRRLASTEINLNEAHIIALGTRDPRSLGRTWPPTMRYIFMPEFDLGKFQIAIRDFCPIVEIVAVGEPINA